MSTFYSCKNCKKEDWLKMKKSEFIRYLCNLYKMCSKNLAILLSEKTVKLFEIFKNECW